MDTICIQVKPPYMTTKEINVKYGICIYILFMENIYIFIMEYTFIWQNNTRSVWVLNVHSIIYMTDIYMGGENDLPMYTVKFNIMHNF